MLIIIRKVLTFFATAILLLFPAQSQGKEIYHRGPWLVNATGDTCNIKLGYKSVEMYFTQMSEGTMFTIEATNFSFREKSANVYLTAPQAGLEMRIGSANYLSIAIFAKMNTASTVNSLKKFATASPKTVQVLDDRRRLLVELPFDNFAPAFAAWNQCVSNNR